MGTGGWGVSHQQSLLRPGTHHNCLPTWVAQAQVMRLTPPWQLLHGQLLGGTFGYHSGFFRLVEAGSQDGHSPKDLNAEQTLVCALGYSGD